VINRGVGFLPEVLARVGQPFNKGVGSEKTGHGLGLAWVKSICRINGWKFEIQQEGDQTICSVDFANTVVQDS
jgi:signal transduction histidine kinase